MLGVGGRIYNKQAANHWRHLPRPQDGKHTTSRERTGYRTSFSHPAPTLVCEEEDKPLCSLAVYACSLSPPQHPKMGTSSPAAAWEKGSPGSQRKYPTLPVLNLFMLHYLSSLHYKIFAHNNQCIHEKGMFTSLFIREIQIKTSRAHPLEGLKLKRQNV